MTPSILVAYLQTLALSMALGLSYQVNIHTSADQKDPATAGNGLARALVVWNSYGQDGDSGGIFARWIDPNGPINGEFRINSLVSGNQAEPAVAMDSAGRLLVAWRGPWEGLDDQEILCRAFDPNGQAICPDRHINTYSQGAQTCPRVAPTPAGGFLVVWASDQGPSSQRSCVLGRLVGTTGEPVGAEIEVSDTPSYAARYPDAAIGPDGTVAVCWLEDRSTDAIRLRLFDPNGVAKSGSVKVNAVGFGSLCRPSVVVLPDGTIFVVWDGDPNRATHDDIRARVLDPNAAPLTDEFIVNTTTPGAQQCPRLAVTRDGNVLVTWEGPGSDPNAGREVFCKLVGPLGQQIGAEMLLNDTAAGDQQSPVSAIVDSGLAVVWEDDTSDGSGSGIFGVLVVNPAQQPEQLSAD